MASIKVRFINDNTLHSYNDNGDPTKGVYDGLLELNNFDDIELISSACITHIERFPKSLKHFTSYRYDAANLHYGPLLTELPEFPEKLEYLHISNTLITELPKFPNSLRIFNCTYNLNLRILPKFPDSLTQIDCSFNALDSLPELSGSLKFLDCRGNQLKSLPSNINKPDVTLFWDTNPIYNVLNEGKSLLDLYIAYQDLETIKKNGENLAKEKADIIAYMYLECKYNPKYKMCRDRVEKEYKELY